MFTDRSRKAHPFCSSLAIATVLLSAAPAAAQSFEGTGTFGSGTGSITTGTGTTTINITSSDAVINWTTFDTATNPGVPINFQTAGTTATFSSSSDFSVLNRVVPTDPSRPIQFNGTVLSRVAQTAGGTVYFYSPGGIIVGAAAIFDVGNLGLTSISPEVVGGIFEQGGAGNEFVRFNGAVTAGSAVTIQPGAHIIGTVGGPGGYLAVVAPQVNQGGVIDGKRVVALVSADAATLTFNPNGLFDIQVTSGTSSTGATLFNSGSITGPAGDAGNASRIYMVAVPKNDAITMAIGSGSTLGFAIADAADVDGNAVVLSAGYDIAGGQIAGTASPGGGTGQAAFAMIGEQDVTSNLIAKATANAFVFANAGEVMNFASGAEVSGAQSSSDPNLNAVQVAAFGPGAQINVAGNLTAIALDPKVVAPASGFTVSNFAAIDANLGGVIAIGGNATVKNNQFSGGPGSAVVSGSARIHAIDGSTITVGGNAIVEASAFTNSSGSATGGSASIGASQLSIVDVAGVMRVLSYGIAGIDNGAGGAGGNGLGGSAQVFATAGGVVAANELNVAADGVGGANVGAGAGSGTGGFANLFATDPGSLISIANGNDRGVGNLGELDFLSAEGFGGWATDSGVGGVGTGGTVDIGVLNGSTINGPATGGAFGLVRIIARGTGGAAGTGATAGGSATGGTINLTVDNATMSSAQLLPSAFALGGSVLATATGAINGGNAAGGTRNITVRNGGVLTTSLGGGSAGAAGGTATATGRGGDATGGLARLNVDNGTFNVTDRALFFTQNTGGDGGIGGSATGGEVFADIVNGGVVDVSSEGPNQRFLVSADNRGGNSFSAPGTAGGSATGGLAQLIVNNGTLASAEVAVSALGIGGGGLVAQGGSGTGGTASFQMRGGSISGTTLRVDASGLGGSIDPSFSGNAGNGAGGFATLEATAGTTSLAFTGVEVRGDGLGGDAHGATGNGGAGLGGTAQIFATNGASLTATVSEGMAVNVDSTGGFAAGAGDGGSGTAGSARVIANGTMTLNGNLDVNGNARGGDGVNGGHGFANPNPNAQNAFVNVSSGTLTVTGETSLDGDISGGLGRDGGNGGNAGSGFAQIFAGDTNGTGLRGTISLQNVGIESNSRGGSAFGTGNGGSAASGRSYIFVNGGDISIAGDAHLEAVASGGDGTNGGNAISPQPFRQPRALIGSFNGTVNVGGFALFDASAFGGNATEPGGGSGGIAFAGQAGIDAQSQNGPSAVTVGDLLINVSASGGFGGEGFSGQGGGPGGDAYGGFAFAQGNAGRGVLTVTGDTLIDATAFGGFGGQGGSGGTTAPGGNGGAGGRAIAGGFNIGTVSGVETTENAGSASFGLVTAIAQAFGGLGGDGGSGITQGNGGSGGTGFGGFGGILVRGSPATFGDVVFDVSGTGGDGGVGAAGGNGGDGYAGDLSVTVTQRFNRSERGTLTAGNVSLFAGGFGGNGAIDGRSFYSAASGSERGFFVRQSDVTLASLALATTGDLAPTVTTTILRIQDSTTGIPVPAQVTVTPEPLDITVAQSTVNVVGDFLITTPGQMLVSLDASTVNVGALTLHAGNFVLPATRPATLGTFNVGSAPSIVTGLDFLAYANFAFPGGFLLGLDGSILTGSITTDGEVDLFAAGSITTDALTGAGVTLDAGSSIATGAVVSGQTIDLTAGGVITTGALTSGDSVFADAGGALTTGPVSSGLVNPVASPADGYRIGLRSQTGITAGDLSAAAAIGVSSPGAIAVGTVSTPQLFLALPGTSLTTGSMTTTSAGQIYIANNSMEALGGALDNAFDPAPILAAQPVSVAGPVTISGQIFTGILRGASTGLFQTHTIGATSVQLSGDAGLTVLSTTAAQSIDLRSSLGTVRSDNLNAGDSVFIAAANGVTINGAAQAGVANPSTAPGAQYKVAIGGGAGAVTTGAVSAARDLGIQTSGAITTGNLAGRDVLLLAGGNLTTGSITASGGAIYFSNVSAANSTHNVFQPFRSPSGMLPIFNTVPIAIGGSANFAGTVQGNNLWGAGQGTLSAQAISTSGFIDLSFGGLATVNGAWRSPRIDLVSGDIAITQTGSLDALSSTGEILLATTNSAGVFLGDGLGATATGYVLDNAEFSRLKAGGIAIIGTDTSHATDMTIGDLTLTGSQLYGADGSLTLATGDRLTETPAGVLRVAGAISGTGFAPTNEIALLSGSVEIEAVQGSIKLADSAGNLSGHIYIKADHIHVASDANLTKLRADPLYAGHITDINTPLAVARPDGVLIALGLEVLPSRTFYVQNTGTASTPAGFLTTFDNSDVIAPSQPPAGGIEVVINGQFQTGTGPVSGRAAFALVQADPTPDDVQFAGFSSTSQLNGCLFLGGACAGSIDPVAAVSSEIRVFVTQVLADSPSAPAAAGADESEETSADEPEGQDDGDTGSSPIAPPAPLVNTRPLNRDANVNEPVSGAGNPALLGSAVNEDIAEGGSQ